LRLVILGIVGTVVGLLAGIGIVLLDFMPEQASEQAVNTDRVYEIMLIVTSGIAGLVTVILVASLLLFRERRGETRVAPPVHGHHGLEVIWTAIPALIVIVLTGISWQTLNENEGGDAGLTVDVWGQQFDWTYDYPDLGLENVHQLVVPVNTKIDFEVQSRDVIHSWWIPAWRQQINATPGQVNKLRVTPNKVGEFKVVCSFICGSGHPVMGTDVEGSIPQRIKVVSKADYDKFVTAEQEKAKASAADPNAAAVAVFNSAGCGGCHAWEPAESKGAVGPSLDDLGADPDAETFVRESIVDPGAEIAEGYPDQMPKDFETKLAPEDLDVLVKALAGGTPQ
jgi:cytochrome c oxidase subunit 2